MTQTVLSNERKTFEDYLKYGEEGEDKVARWLLSKGVVVAPLYQFENHNKAPVVLLRKKGLTEKRIMPDLQCYKNSVAFFVEVKRKNQWWFGNYRDGNGDCDPETGIDLRVWRHYLDVRERTGINLWLYFIQESNDPTGLYVGEVLQLLKSEPRVWTNGASLVFFRKSQLQKLADVDQL